MNTIHETLSDLQSLFSEASSGMQAALTEYLAYGKDGWTDESRPTGTFANVDVVARSAESKSDGERVKLIRRTRPNGPVQLLLVWYTSFRTSIESFQADDGTWIDYRRDNVPSHVLPVHDVVSARDLCARLSMAARDERTAALDELDDVEVFETEAGVEAALGMEELDALS